MFKLNRERMLDDMHKRFRHWMDMYTDKGVSDETLYLELCASIYSGNKEDDFPDEFKSEPVKISDNEFRYRDTVFRITRDDSDDKSYIWCNRYMESDELVWWTWGVTFASDTWLIGTDVLDKFIDSHKEED